MPVSVTSNATTADAADSTGWSALQPDAARAMRSFTPPCSVNLMALESRFLSTCCRRFESVVIDLSSGSMDTRQGQASPLGLVPERTRNQLLEIAQRDLLGVDRDRAGFDLGKIQDVADQIEQVRSRAVDRPRKLHLSRRQVAVGVVCQLLAEDQDAVERRAQLVRHVGQELGLVLGGQRELRGLFLQRAAGLFDLLILALDLGVLLGKLLRLLLELLVGLLQLLLLGLQLRRRAAAIASADLRSASSPRCC